MWSGKENIWFLRWTYSPYIVFSNCRIGLFFCRSLSRVGDICSHSCIFRYIFERSCYFFISVMLNRQGTSDPYSECFYSERPRLGRRTRRCELFGSVVNIRLRDYAASEQRVCFASEPRLSCRDGGLSFHRCGVLKVLRVRGEGAGWSPVVCSRSTQKIWARGTGLVSEG